MDAIDRLEIDVERCEESDADGHNKRKALSELLAKWLERAYKASQGAQKETAENLQNSERNDLITAPNM